MLRVVSCCGCFDLEQGGKIWGVLGIIGGIICTVLSLMNIQGAFQFSPIFGVFMIFGAVYSIATLTVSGFLLKGVENQSHDSIKPARILAPIGYVYGVAYILYIAFTNEIKKTLMETFREFRQQIPERAIDDAIFQGKLKTTGIVLVCIILDFVFRFLVIETLYQKYKEAKKPRQNI